MQLHEGLETIGAGSLSDTALDRFAIPSTVTNIDDAFYNSFYTLEGIHPMYVTALWWEPIAITENTFPNRRNATLFVPAGKEDVYRAAPYWQDFGTITSCIEFDDPAVKAICIANWDTNHDGELTYEEAAEVTTLGEAFKGNTEIHYFNELQYFTGLVDDYHHVLTYEAFQGCSGLIAVTLPSNITWIGNRAFQGCSSLTYLSSIPDAVTNIGDQAFEDCSSLTSIYLPTSLRMISYYMFKGCSSLRWISIPKGITYYGDMAFEGCTALTQVTVHETTPPVIDTERNDPFPTRSSIKLIVPAHSGDAYRTADYWKEFQPIEEAEPEWTGIYTDENGDQYQYEIGYSAQLYHYADNSSRTTFIMPSAITVDGAAYPVTAIYRLGSSYLQTLTIPASVTEVKDNAITCLIVEGTGLTLKDIYMRGSEPPVAGNFSDWIASIKSFNMQMEMQYPGDPTKQVSLKDITLHVPTGSLADYQAATFWKEFTVVEYDLPATETYVLLSTDRKTLTFYNDCERANRQGTFYDLNTGTTAPGWNGHVGSVTTVVFDPSFAEVRPTSTYVWFSHMGSLTAINGMQYLDTRDVTIMRGMFSNCIVLPSVDVSHFNTANVTDMKGMFGGCWELKSIDLSNFNTSKVTDMSHMFYSCTELTELDLSNFNTSAVMYTSQMFYSCLKLTTIYIGNGWTMANVDRTDDDSHSLMFCGASKLVGSAGTTYDASVYEGAGIDIGYAHIDGGSDNPGYFSYRPYAVLTDATLTFYCDGFKDTRTGTTFYLNEGATAPGWYGKVGSVTTVVFDPSFAGARPTSTFAWFYNMQSLTTINGLTYLNTSEVTDMRNMFYNCLALEHLDLSSFNTEEVVYMNNMFLFCLSLQTIDLSSFNTSKVKNMSQMFGDCEALTTIYAGNGWTTDAIEGQGNQRLFLWCINLVGGQGTTYDESPYTTEGGAIDAQYARIDGGTDSPGYFTAKPDFKRGDVNGDGQVTIADVTALVNIILGKTTAPANGVADVNGDHNVTIADVTALVNIILGKN